jgi:hypothetical protein
MKSGLALDNGAWAIFFKMERGEKVSNVETMSLVTQLQFPKVS